jgi:hypothetical protein
MKRLLPAIWLGCLTALAVDQTAPAQDDIRYVDRATRKELPATGSVLEETPSRVVYKPGTGAGTKEVAASDVIDIAYDVPGAVRLPYGRARADERKATDPTAKEEERKRALTDAVKTYQEILPKLTGDRYKFALRHTHFKIARLQALLAEDDPTKTDTAVAVLASFKKDYPDGWQIGQAAKLLARLQLEKGDADAARKTYEDLAATPDLSKDARQEYELLAVDALIQTKKCALAEKKLQAMLKTLPTEGPQATRARVYLAECLGVSGKLPEAVSQLEEIIAETADKDLKAAAYNGLGDCYRLSGRPKEALWPYLWVDVIYHQDRQEHAKAMAQLAKLFEQQGDKAHAKLYKDKLKRESR